VRALTEPAGSLAGSVTVTMIKHVATGEDGDARARVPSPFP